jgi:hypothetical protein
MRPEATLARVALYLAEREYRRQQVWHELREASQRVADLIDELRDLEPRVPEPRWRNPLQLELRLVAPATLGGGR